MWVFLSTFYSLKPIRLKTKGYFNILTIVLAQRILPILLLFSAFSFWILPDTIIILFYVLLRGLSSDINHQLVDYQLDNTTGTMTFVQKLGFQKSQKIFTMSLEVEKLILFLLLIVLTVQLNNLYSGCIIWIIATIMVFYWLSYFYGFYLVLNGQRRNPFQENDKNIFQFLHHAFPSVLLPLILCTLMLKFNFSYFLLFIIIIINKRLYKPKILSNSYPLFLLKKLKTKI